MLDLSRYLEERREKKRKEKKRREEKRVAVLCCTRALEWVRFAGLR